METALKELQKNNADFAKMQIEATHDYVRIEAETEEAFVAIQSKRELDLSIYPIDYKVVKQGKFYKEKDYTTKYPVFWTATPVNYIFPKELKVKVLEKLFLPKGTDLDEYNRKRPINASQLEAIEEKSLSLFDKRYSNTKGARVTGYQPWGVVKVWDEYKNQFLPIVGIPIRISNFWSSSTVVTSATGYYQSGSSFNIAPDVKITWKKDGQFELCSDNNGNFTFTNATTTKSNITTTECSFNIVGNSPQIGYFSPTDWRLGHMWRASYLYYNNNQAYFLKKPPLPGSACLGLMNISFSGTNILRIGSSNGQTGTAVGWADNSHTWMRTGVQGGVHIVINTPPSTPYYTGFDIFATTIHELTHAQHFDMGMTRTQYLTNHRISALAESWALGVEYVVTMNEYNIKNTTYFPSSGSLNQFREYDYRPVQNKAIADYNVKWDFLDFTHAYTPYFIDLLDNFNQRYAFSSIAFMNEDIQIPNLQYLQSLMILYPSSFGSVNSSLKTNYPSHATKIQEMYDAYTAGVDK